MRKPQEITVDRTLLIYGLHLAQEQDCFMVSDVKVHQLIFLAELQMLGKGVRGLHYEFMRFPYGAFSKDLDNDLLALRKKERLQNFDVVGSAEDCIPLVEEEVTPGVEANEQVVEILQSVVETYGPQDVGEITKSVEDVEISVGRSTRGKIMCPGHSVSFHRACSLPHRSHGRFFRSCQNTGSPE